jgi:hypothetical protein
MTRAWALYLLLVLLSACGRVDSRATLFPESWRQAAPDPQLRPEPEPDAPRLIRDNLKHIFIEGSQPTNVRLSGLRRNPTGNGWNVCIKATIVTVGKATRAVTYLIPLERGEIGLRRVAAPQDGCETESYTRI